MAASEARSRSGLSLYANLLSADNPDAAPGTISSAPVVYKQPPQSEQSQEPLAAEKSQISSAALRFQPTRRPQVAAQKAKSRQPAQRPPPPSHQGPIVDETNNEHDALEPRQPAKTLADWTADGDEDDVNGFYAAEKRQRGGRKKRKKNKVETHVRYNWDDIYDPSRPNIYEDYKHSDEKYLEIREWKDRLYAHRIARGQSSDSDNDDGPYRKTMSSRFAPPPALSSNTTSTAEAPKPTPIAETVDTPSDVSGENAYLRRMQISHPPSFTPPQQRSLDADALADGNEKIAVKAPARSPDVSRAPVRYNLPPPPAELPSTETELEAAMHDDGMRNNDTVQEDDAPRSLRPGQKGFAERLMSKYGWTKGSGLGASESGITAPLRVQKEKQKKKPDSEGGGYVGASGMGKIIGGQRKGGGEAGSIGKFGIMSEVIKLGGMLDGIDLDEELQTSDGGLMQEIGEECGEKYGRVERVYIDRGIDAGRASVFVRFTSQLSALRAVNALEGRIFNGNAISAKFFEPQKLEAGIYD